MSEHDQKEEPVATTAAATETTAKPEDSKAWGKDGSVNDYSRFDKVDDPDNEDPLAESTRSKNRGNDAFKASNYSEAITHYTEAISDLPPKRDDKKNDAARQLRVSAAADLRFLNGADPHDDSHLLNAEADVLLRLLRLR